MNNFIVSSKGFLKSIIFDKENNKHEIEYTQLLREAKRFKSKAAIELIKKFEIDGFIWNPYKEEPIKDKWCIYQRNDYYTFLDEETHNVLEWLPKKVVMESKTDVKHLTSNGINNIVYYDSYEEAAEVCRLKNTVMIKELQDKINKL